MKKDIRKVIKKNSKTFYWGVSSLSKPQKEAMYTIYAFLRHIDDIIYYSDMSLKDKKNVFSLWREEFDNIYDKKVATNEISRNMYKNCMRFKIPKEEFIKFLDASERELITSDKPLNMKDFLEYCRGASGTTCNFTLRILGFPNQEIIEELSTFTGNAIEMTIVLRDVKDSAMLGQIYIPKESLEKAGIKEKDPEKIITHTNLFIARKDLADMTRENFEKAYEIIEKIDKKYSKILKIGMNVSKSYFDIMDKRGWEIISPKPKISWISRLNLTLKSMRGELKK